MSQAAAQSICSGIEALFVLILQSDEGRMTQWERQNIEEPLAYIIQNRFTDYLDEIFSVGVYSRLFVAGGAYAVRMYGEIEHQQAERQRRREMERAVRGLPKAAPPPSPPPSPPPPPGGNGAGGIRFDFDARPDWLERSEGGET